MSETPVLAEQVKRPVSPSAEVQPKRRLRYKTPPRPTSAGAPSPQVLAVHGHHHRGRERGRSPDVQLRARTQEGRQDQDGASATSKSSPSSAFPVCTRKVGFRHPMPNLRSRSSECCSGGGGGLATPRAGHVLAEADLPGLVARSRLGAQTPACRSIKITADACDRAEGGEGRPPASPRGLERNRGERYTNRGCGRKGCSLDPQGDAQAPAAPAIPSVGSSDSSSSSSQKQFVHTCEGVSLPHFLQPSSARVFY